MSKENQKKLLKDFSDSYNEWYSWCMVPLSYREMLKAVACGDAEVELTEDSDWPADFFFKWNRKKEDRKETYMSFYEDQIVAVFEDGVVSVSKVIKENEDTLELLDFEDPVHKSKVVDVEFTENFPYVKIDDLIDDAEDFQKITSQMIDCKNQIHEGDFDKKIVITCPICEGSGHEGFDREDPPNPYVCQYCDGEKELSLSPHKKKEMPTETQENAVDFEERYGSIDFLKIAMSALNQLLVSKNVIKPEQLQEYLEKEMDTFKRNY
jgi:hypothetical protein